MEHIDREVAARSELIRIEAAALLKRRQHHLRHQSAGAVVALCGRIADRRRRCEFATGRRTVRMAAVPVPYSQARTTSSKPNARFKAPKRLKAAPTVSTPTPVIAK